MAPALPIMDSMSAGLLPKWLLLISIVSIANSVQAYLTMSYVIRVYPGSSPPAATPGLAASSSGSRQSRRSKEPSASAPPEDSARSPVTPLSSRTFGTWTLLSGVVRAYAACNIHDPLVYQLALWSYVIVCLHFGSEWIIFGTTQWGKGLAGPVIIGSSTLIWMLAQWNFYVVV